MLQTSQKLLQRTLGKLTLVHTVPVIGVAQHACIRLFAHTVTLAPKHGNSTLNMENNLHLPCRMARP